MISMSTAEHMAQTALDHWGGGTARLVTIRENVVFDVTLRGGARVAMRLHRPGYRSRAAIEAELTWCEALAASGFPAPAPVSCRDGMKTVQVSDRIVSCVAWIDGQTMGMPKRAQVAQIGELIARLHLAPQTPLLSPKWDTATLLGPQPTWGRFWENPHFNAEDRAILEAARAGAQKRLASGGYEIGAIHGDLLHENILRTDQGLALIDFDDCAEGYLLYDLATALIQSFEAADFKGRCEALLAGYQRIRPLAQAEDLSLFIALRAFASAGWIMSRAANDDPRSAIYAARAKIAAAQFLEDYV